MKSTAAASGQEDDNNNYISEIDRRCQNDNEVQYRVEQNDTSALRLRNTWMRRSTAERLIEWPRPHFFKGHSVSLYLVNVHTQPRF